MSEQLLVRKAEAAKLLGDMPESTLEKLTCRKQVPHIKLGRAVYYDPADLRAWIASKKIAASAGALAYGRGMFKVRKRGANGKSGNAQGRKEKGQLFHSVYAE